MWAYLEDDSRMLTVVGHLWLERWRLRLMFISFFTPFRTEKMNYAFLMIDTTFKTEKKMCKEKPVASAT